MLKVFRRYCLIILLLQCLFVFQGCVLIQLAGGAVSMLGGLLGQAFDVAQTMPMPPPYAFF